MVTEIRHGTEGIPLACAREECEHPEHSRRARQAEAEVAYYVSEHSRRQFALAAWYARLADDVVARATEIIIGRRSRSRAMNTVKKERG